MSLVAQHQQITASLSKSVEDRLDLVTAPDDTVHLHAMLLRATAQRCQELFKVLYSFPVLALTFFTRCNIGR